MLKEDKAVDDVVTAIELAAIRRDREKLEALRGQAGSLAISLSMREQDVIARIERGARVDGVAVVMTRRRQNISWLSIVKRELGEEAVIRAKDEWPVVFYKELQIG